MARNVGMHGRPVYVSDVAEPPITLEETGDAEVALCPTHRSKLSHLNVSGRVMYCPLGGMHWRVPTKGQRGMFARLDFPRGL